MFIKFEKNVKSRKGQISAFFTILLIVLLIFTLVTINIGRVSQVKTDISITTDNASLYLASSLGSIANSLWRSILAHEKKNADEEPSEYKICKINWVSIVSFGVTVFFALVSFGTLGAALSKFFGLKFSIFSTISGGGSIGLGELQITKGLSYLNRKLQEMTQPKEQILLNTAILGLTGIVDDPNMESDRHDIDEDGDTEELVSRFSVWLSDFIRKFKNKDQIVDRLVSALKIFFNTSDSFRQGWSGFQEYPELINHEDWITTLRCCTDPVKLDKGSPPPDNNPYYPEDGSLMYRLADFEAKRIGRQGSGKKEPLKIDNINISQLDSLKLDSVNISDLLFNYNEEIRYDFPFWRPNFESGGMELPYDTDDVIDYKKGKCNLGGMGEEGIGLARGYDEVDFLIDSLERFRYWAYGFYAEDPEAQDMVRFFPSLVNPNLPSLEYKASFRYWFPQFYNIDHPNDIELTQRSWYVRLLDLYAKTYLNPYSHEDTQYGCGWYLELNKILRLKPFFNKEKSDISANAGSGYSGLGVMKFGQGFSLLGQFRKPYPGGKRRELVEKMDKICKKINEFINEFNKSERRSPEVSWEGPCGDSVYVPTTTPLHTLDCRECYTLLYQYNLSYCKSQCCGDCTSCLDKIKNDIDKKIKDIETQIKQLEEAKQKCVDCYKRLLENCLNDCAIAHGNCTDSCSRKCESLNEPERSECVTDCNINCSDDLENCKDNCNKNYGDPEGRCGAIFDEPINRRKKEIENLNNILILVEKMAVLGKSLKYVESLIADVEDIQDEIEFFAFSLKNPENPGLLDFIDNNLEILRFVGELDCRQPQAKFGGKIPSWFSQIRSKIGNYGLWNDSCDFVLTYSWNTTDASGNTLHHHARVTVFDFPMPEVKTHRCAWIFGRGATLLNYDGKVAVVVEKFDQDKIVALGGVNKWFNWGFRTRPINPWEFGCGSVESVATDPNEALRCYAIRSYSIASYYPEIESGKHPGKGIKIIETK